MMSGHRSDRGIAHAGKQVVIRHVARSDQLDAGLVEAAFGELLHERAALTGGHEDKDGVRFGVSGALQEILNAGATVIGKTVCDEFFYSVSGANAHYGTPVNPRGPGRVPGGSSRGSGFGAAPRGRGFG